MSSGYVVRPSAARDIDDIADFLAEQGGLEIGLEFLNEVYETFGLLASQNELGWPCRIPHPLLARTRVFRVSERFQKYLIFYRSTAGQVEMIRVIHGAQDLPALFEREGADSE